MILVTNDDGIDSQGLVALQQALRQVDEVVVLAPDRNWTAAGHTRTLHRPLRVDEVRLPDGHLAYSSDGTPSDCVALALMGFVGEQPRLIVSGINKGPNLGTDITYSGTVAAAVEGVVWGVPSVAVSLGDYQDWDFTYAAEFARQLARELLERRPSGQVLLNVNIPNVPRHEISGVEITRLGRREYHDELIRRKDPFGRDYFWIGGQAPTGALEPGTDVAAIAHNRISVTPILTDLTNYALLDELRSWRLQP